MGWIYVPDSEFGAGDPRVVQKLDRIIRLLGILMQRERHVAGELDRIEQQIGPLTSAVDSSVTLMYELSKLIKDNINDPVRLAAIADALVVDSQKLGEAVAANTPAAP